MGDLRAPPNAGRTATSVSLGHYSADPLRNTRATNTCHRTPAGVLIERGHHGRQCISRCFGARRRPPAAAEATHALHPGTNDEICRRLTEGESLLAHLPCHGHAHRRRRQAVGQTGPGRVRRPGTPRPEN